jgi:hypothetical protein
MKKLIFLILLSLSQPSLADWVKWAIADDGNEYYVELKSIKTLSNNKKRVWIYVNFNNANPGSNRSGKSYEEYDCKEDSYKILQAVSYSDINLKGNTFPLEIPNQKIMYTSPSSVRELLLKNILCK